MFEMDRTAGIMILDSEGFLRSALKPTLYTNADLSIGHVEVNMSNLEFKPAKLPRKLLQHGIAMGPMGSTPGWAMAVGTTKIPADIISGKPWDGGTLADRVICSYQMVLGSTQSDGSVFNDNPAYTE